VHEAADIVVESELGEAADLDAVGEQDRLAVGVRWLPVEVDERTSALLPRCQERHQASFTGPTDELSGSRQSVLPSAAPASPVDNAAATVYEWGRECKEAARHGRRYAMVPATLGGQNRRAVSS
jgi:hypothetical protein